MEKICVKCGVLSPLDQFNKSPTSKDGLRSECKSCRSIMNKRYFKCYDPEKSKMRYEKNREKVKADQKRRREENPEYYRDYNEKYYKDPIKRAKILFTKTKIRAIRKGLEFDIDKSRIEKAFLIGKCERTGIGFDFNPYDVAYHRNPFAPSIDKRDPFGGYTSDNVQIVCNAYNFAKGQMTDDEFIDFCRTVVEFNK